MVKLSVHVAVRPNNVVSLITKAFERTVKSVMSEIKHSLPMRAATIVKRDKKNEWKKNMSSLNTIQYNYFNYTVWYHTFIYMSCCWVNP